ncbi:fructosamine kinase family protein [Reinekea blandensis]|uniref:Fructosamine kinase family protein n=1 Tax=Reinekea blandensis MED297 TaxID=314283 RepID=A4BFX5_9GAMM|nr:fructosamine kinase family protein [Reinekea blandensis]EAR08993.1 hypothetical protein MED297_03852 [Reinekea sp. MED297] [Reinekea blandensis MED297]
MTALIQQLLQQCQLAGEERLTATPCHGGQINQAYRVEGSGPSLFVKLQRTDDADFFTEEARALTELSEVGGLSTPKVLAQSAVGDVQALVLTWCDLSGLPAAGFFMAGQQLARCHQVTQTSCGWYADNLLGTTVQPNDWQSNWGDFFIEQRLTPLIHQLDEPALTRRLPDLTAFHDCFREYQPAASLLHGDLWSGNLAGDKQGRPVFFDPASYYGDRETDLALTELFGGFPAEFYQGYEAVWPLDAGYPRRRPWYQLYHILNHALIFGGAYLSDAQHRLERVLHDN